MHSRARVPLAIRIHAKNAPSRQSKGDLRTARQLSQRVFHIQTCTASSWYVPDSTDVRYTPSQTIHSPSKSRLLALPNERLGYPPHSHLQNILYFYVLLRPGAIFWEVADESLHLSGSRFSRSRIGTWKWCFVHWKFSYRRAAGQRFTKFAEKTRLPSRAQLQDVSSGNAFLQCRSERLGCIF